MFSVVIPLYNKQDSITNTINSVLSQSFKEFEIIIVNDGSTDNSFEIVKKMEDPRIKLIDKSNGGVSSARNRGIKEAKYEWICFLDADDLWTENHLKEFYDVIVKNSKLNWLFSGYTSKNSKKEYKFIYNKSGIINNVIDELLNGIKIHTSTVCVKKNLFLKFKDLYFTEGINNSEDREVWYKLSCIDQSPYYIDKSLSFYMLDTPNSLTKTNTKINEGFLTMKDRIATFLVFTEITKENSEKIYQFIDKYNVNAIMGLYIKSDKLNDELYSYLNVRQRKVLKNSIFLPKIIKKTIIRLIY